MILMLKGKDSLNGIVRLLCIFDVQSAKLSILTKMLRWRFIHLFQQLLPVDHIFGALCESPSKQSPQGVSQG